VEDSDNYRKTNTRQKFTLQSIDFGLPSLTSEILLNTLNSEKSESEIGDILTKYNLKAGVPKLEESTGLNFLNTMIILRQFYPKIGQNLIKRLLDHKKIDPFEKDSFNCSPMFYTKLLEDVKLTSLLFDYIIYYKKQLVQ
jgi:hypothetical protein